MALVENLVQEILKVPGISHYKITRFSCINIVYANVYQPYNWDIARHKFLAKLYHSFLKAAIIITINLIYSTLTAMVNFKSENQKPDFGNMYT